MTRKKNPSSAIFAAALRMHRERLNLTQQQLSEVLGVSFEAVSKWERGVSEPAVITQEGALARLVVAVPK